MEVHSRRGLLAGIGSPQSVRAGPTDTPSLADDQAEFQRLNDELFGNGTGLHTVGKGKV
jgi:hypothetical protein